MSLDLCLEADSALTISALKSALENAAFLLTREVRYLGL